MVVLIPLAGMLILCNMSSKFIVLILKTRHISCAYPELICLTSKEGTYDYFID